MATMLSCGENHQEDFRITMPQLARRLIGEVSPRPSFVPVVDRTGI
jgi:hypothetical protein